MSKGLSVVRIISSAKMDIDGVDAVTVTAKTYPWCARVLADVPFYVAVGESPTATDSDMYINEFDDSMLLSVGAGEEISILGSDTGTANICEVKPSAA